MDLKLYGNILWRHWKLLLLGVVLAGVFAVFSFYRVELGVPPQLTPRKAEVWQSQATVLLTENGFPVGRRTNEVITKVIAGEPVAVPKYNDPNFYASLASLYARFAMSDDVSRRMRKGGPVPGAFGASAGLDPSRRESEPIVQLSGVAETGAAARETVDRGLGAFVAYVRARQVAAKIPKAERIQLRVLNQPRPAVLIEPRKMTLPIVVFLAVLIASIAFVFILENSRRRPSLVEVEPTPIDVDTPLIEIERKPVLDDEPEPERPAASARRWA